MVASSEQIGFKRLHCSGDRVSKVSQWFGPTGIRCRLNPQQRATLTPLNTLSPLESLERWCTNVRRVPPLIGIWTMSCQVKSRIGCSLTKLTPPPPAPLANSQNKNLFPFQPGHPGSLSHHYIPLALATKMFPLLATVSNSIILFPWRFSPLPANSTFYIN